ncbi:MAG: exopolyphosphatase [Bacteroidia bacterium]|nr:exopolyphosphatase [Bacteroidia bacterium]
MMHKSLLFASVDIGSNAVRLLFSRVFKVDGKPEFVKEELIRMPVRLGEDVFVHNQLSEEKIARLLKTLQAFKLLIDSYGVLDYRAVATSAMRDAKNGPEVIQKIKNATGLNIEIIDGNSEAKFLFSNHIEEKLDKEKSYLYVDVGGGSTELSIYHKNKIHAYRSFNIGTVRMLHKKDKPEEWEEMRNWINKNTRGIFPLHAIGSGGNINKVFKMIGKKENKYITLGKLKDFYTLMSGYTLDERMERFLLKPDRADVIVPACKIYIQVMRTAEIERIYVPQIGLSDGIIHELYEKHRHLLK